MSLRRSREIGKSTPTVVYFVLATKARVFKIGATADVEKRLDVLGRHSPVPLQLLGTIVGGETVERWCHYHCIHDRSHSEWFKWNKRTQRFFDWLLAHGSNAADMVCGREAEADRALAASRSPRFNLHPLPDRRSTDNDVYLELMRKSATQVGFCQCDPCGVYMEERHKAGLR